jgi:hypothetical protein
MQEKCLCNGQPCGRSPFAKSVPAVLAAQRRRALLTGGKNGEFVASWTFSGGRPRRSHIDDVVAGAGER